ncbi:MAG: hypothetical protein E7462_02205 [Ruminococcaceae bacterium]|nr:hypothetical protein [Oscillospiraceae bacterium]
MTNKKTRRPIRFVWKRSSKSTVLAVCAAIVTATAAILVVRSLIPNNDALREQVQQQEQENKAQQDKNDNLGSVESVEQIAQEELGMGYPDTTVIQPEN